MFPQQSWSTTPVRCFCAMNFWNSGHTYGRCVNVRMTWHRQQRCRQTNTSECRHAFHNSIGVVRPRINWATTRDDPWECKWECAYLVIALVVMLLILLFVLLFYYELLLLCPWRPNIYAPCGQRPPRILSTLRINTRARRRPQQFGTYGSSYVQSQSCADTCGRSLQTPTHGGIA